VVVPLFIYLLLLLRLKLFAELLRPLPHQFPIISGVNDSFGGQACRVDGQGRAHAGGSRWRWCPQYGGCGSVRDFRRNAWERLFSPQREQNLCRHVRVLRRAHDDEVVAEPLSSRTSTSCAGAGPSCSKIRSRPLPGGTSIAAHSSRQPASAPRPALRCAHQSSIGHRDR